MSGGHIPTQLLEVGPSLDWKLRRTRVASEDLFRSASKMPKALKPKAVKNISHNELGEKLGRMHMEKQDLSKLQTRKMKGLKRKGRDADADGPVVKKQRA